MKRSITLLCVLVLLFAATGAVSAGKPSEDSFTIAGYTTAYTYEKLPNGLTSFHLVAKSNGATEADENFCSSLYTCRVRTPARRSLGSRAVSRGDLTGQFTFEEWGVVDFDPGTGTGSGEGKNEGILTITTSEGQVVMKFKGKADLQGVRGKFDIDKKAGTGIYHKFDGKGKYDGDAGLVFTVTFTGKFKD